MKNKKKSPKKVRKARNKEYKIIVRIISDALIRIFARRTERSFQQELHFISKQIQEFVDTSYIPKAIHTKTIVEQRFGYINLLEDELKYLKKDGSELDIQEGVRRSLEILKKESRK
jgi:hypothetical protein